MRPCGLPPPRAAPAPAPPSTKTPRGTAAAAAAAGTAAPARRGAAPACTARSPRRRRRPARRSPRAFAAAAGSRSRRRRCSGRRPPRLGWRVGVGVGLRAVLRRRRLRAYWGGGRAWCRRVGRVAGPAVVDAVPVANTRGLVVPSVVRIAVVLRHPTVRRPSLLARLRTSPSVLARPFPSLRVEARPTWAARHIGIRTGRRRRCCRAKIFRGRRPRGRRQSSRSPVRTTFLF